MKGNKGIFELVVELSTTSFGVAIAVWALEGLYIQGDLGEYEEDAN